MPISSSNQQQQQEKYTSFRFSSPFIGISFRALIEKPSDRNVISNNPNHLNEKLNKQSYKRDISGLGLKWGESEVNQQVIAESPPRKRQAIVSIQESPVINHCGMGYISYLNQYRSM